MDGTNATPATPATVPASKYYVHTVVGLVSAEMDKRETKSTGEHTQPITQLFRQLLNGKDEITAADLGIIHIIVTNRNGQANNPGYKAVFSDAQRVFYQKLETAIKAAEPRISELEPVPVRRTVEHRPHGSAFVRTAAPAGSGVTRVPASAPAFVRESDDPRKHKPILGMQSAPPRTSAPAAVTPAKPAEPKPAELPAPSASAPVEPAAPPAIEPAATEPEGFATHGLDSAPRREVAAAAEETDNPPAAATDPADSAANASDVEYVEGFGVPDGFKSFSDISDTLKVNYALVKPVRAELIEKARAKIRAAGGMAEVALGESMVKMGYFKKNSTLAPPHWYVLETQETLNAIRKTLPAHLQRTSTGTEQAAPEPEGFAAEGFDRAPHRGTIEAVHETADSPSPTAAPLAPERAGSSAEVEAENIDHSNVPDKPPGFIAATKLGALIGSNSQTQNFQSMWRLMKAEAEKLPRGKDGTVIIQLGELPVKMGYFKSVHFRGWYVSEDSAPAVKTYYEATYKSASASVANAPASMPPASAGFTAEGFDKAPARSIKAADDDTGDDATPEVAPAAVSVGELPNAAPMNFAQAEAANFLAFADLAQTAKIPYRDIMPLRQQLIKVAQVSRPAADGTVLVNVGDTPIAMCYVGTRARHWRVKADAAAIEAIRTNLGTILEMPEVLYQPEGTDKTPADAGFAVSTPSQTADESEHWRRLVLSRDARMEKHREMDVKRAKHVFVEASLNLQQAFVNLKLRPPELLNPITALTLSSEDYSKSLDQVRESAVNLKNPMAILYLTRELQELHYKHSSLKAELRDNGREAA